MQKKQIVQFVSLIALLAVMVCAYFGIQSYNAAQEEKEKQRQEGAKITLTAFQPEDITGISYDFGGETYEYEKSGKKWKFKGDDSLKIDQDAFHDFLKSVGSIQAQTKVTPADGADASKDGDPGKAGSDAKKAGSDADNEADSGGADTDYGFDKPSRTVTITRDKGTSSLVFGMKNEMLGQYYVKTSESGQIYLVEEEVFTMFDKRAEDFKEAEDTDADDGAKDTDEDEEAGDADDKADD